MNTSQIKEGFLVTPPTVQREGENMMTVQYEGYTAVFSVTGKKVMYIEAEYTNNEEVTVGTELVRKNIRVKAFYTDGSTNACKSSFCQRSFCRKHRQAGYYQCEYC